MTNERFKLYRDAWVILDRPHDTYRISTEVAKKLLAGGGKFVRNIYNWDSEQKAPFYYVIKDSFDGMDELPSKVRNQVKKSLKTYEFRIVTCDEMGEKGMDLYNKSRERFGIKESQFDKESWNRLAYSAGHDFWMGFDRITGEPASFAINKVFSDYCDYRTMGFDPKFSNNTYPMYGLIYEMNRYYLQELGLKYVLDGVRSITEHSNIQPFLEDKFKFRKAYCDLQVFYKSWLGLAVNILFPFRKFIKHPKVSAILRQEAWARGLE